MFHLRCKICEIKLGKFLVTFLRQEKANFSEFFGFGQIFVSFEGLGDACMEFNNCSIPGLRPDQATKCRPERESQSIQQGPFF